MNTKKIQEKTKKLKEKTKHLKAKAEYKRAKKAASPFKKLPTLEIKFGKRKQGRVIKRKDRRIHLF